MITAFLLEAIQARRHQGNIFKVLKEKKKSYPKILHLAKIFLKC